MRSLIITEVEHGDDTDALQQFAEDQAKQAEYWGCTVLDYNVRVDVGDTYVIRSWDNPTTECDCDIDILDPKCTNPEHLNPPKGF